MFTFESKNGINCNEQKWIKSYQGMLWESCKSIPQGYTMFPEKVAKLWNVVPHTKVGTILYSMVQNCRVWVCTEYYATSLLFDVLIIVPYTDI